MALSQERKQKIYQKVKELRDYINEIVEAYGLSDDLAYLTQKKADRLVLEIQQLLEGKE